MSKEIEISWVIQKIGEKGISTRRVFIPLNEMPYLKQYSMACPNAYEIYNSGICLPGSMLNKENDIEEVALAIKEVLNG